MKYRIRCYSCDNQNQLVASVAHVNHEGYKLVASPDVENIPGQPAPIPVFPSYPQSVLDALFDDPDINSPEIEDLIAEKRSTDDDAGNTYSQPLLLIAHKALP